MTNTTGWLSPPTAIRGLDHLGVQAPCVALYSELLPGLTNVTDRARYFTFHPWFVWAFERHFADRSEPSYARAVRGAECLMTLAAIRHRETTGGTLLVHDVATIGNRKLGAAYGRLAETGSIDLAQYAAFDGETPNVYFKARWGGLGQYYLGSLFDLRLMDYQKERTPLQPGYDAELGVAVAHAFDGAVPRERFFEVLQRGQVTATDLDDLAPFCPCQIGRNDAERELLASLLFARRPAAQDEGREARRDSLLLLLEIARVARPMSLEEALRGGAYTGALPPGEPWALSEQLSRARERWGVYHRNELFSLSVQGLFWAVLQGVDQHRRGRLRGAADAGELLVMLATEAGMAGTLSRPMRDVVADTARDLPVIAAWDDPMHEHASAYEIASVAGRFEAPSDGLGATVERCVLVLLALLARRRADAPFPYFDFPLPRERFGGDELDLATFETAARGWYELSVGAWLRWIAENWCVRHHLRVALRKLRASGQDTFRLRPLDDGLRLVEVAPAGFTGPRVNNAEQVLFDLGMLERDPSDGRLNITALGMRELEVGRG